MHPLAGKKQSPEHIAKRVAKQLGQKRTVESRKKMAAAKRGQKYSDERLLRNAERLKAQVSHLNTSEAIAKRAASRRGKPRDAATIAKMSAAAKRQWEALNEAERIKALVPWIKGGQKAAMQVVNGTTLEQIVEETLKATSVKYEKQFRISYYICDFCLPDTKTIIEVHGCYWHQCPICGYDNHRTEEIRAKDARKTAYLESKGYTVKVIWEHSLPGYRLRKSKRKS